MNKLLIAVIFLPCALFGQLHDAIWKIGQVFAPSLPTDKGLVIDFRNGNPINYLKACPLTLKVGYNFSDSTGNEIFYTDGMKINTSNDSTVEGGFDQTCYYCKSVPAGYFVLLRPENPSQYYLLYFATRNNQTIPNVFQYSILDMAENNGKGKVIVRDSTIFKPMFSPPLLGVKLAMSATKHGNGRDWWVTISIRDLVAQFETFLIDPTGVHLVHEQIIGSTPVFTNGIDGSSALKFSEDGSKLLQSEGGAADIFNFDRCTGLISLGQTVPFYGTYIVNGGAIMSKDNRYLYHGFDSSVYQFDLQAPDILTSRIELFKDHLSNGMWTMQYALDGRVYGASINPQPLDTTYTKWENWMQGINFPSKKGSACGAKMRFFKTPTYAGYPPNYPNYRLGPLDGSPCDTLGLDNHPLAWFRWDFVDTLEPRKVEFTDNSAYEPTSWQWDFAGLGTSNDTNPIFTFPSDGVYKVCLTVCNQNSCDSVCHLVTIGTTAVGESPKSVADLFIFPNPAQDNLMISMPQFTGFESRILQLINPLGQLLQTQTFDGGQAEIDVSRLPAGLVFVQILDSGKIKAVGKVVIQH